MSTIETVTGQFIDLLEPDPRTIVLEDIAWSLSRIPRYCGHTVMSVAYSVAQHSLFVSREISKFMPPELLNDELTVLRYQLYGLMHDATEAYTNDIPGPVKHLPGIEEAIMVLEDKLEAAIFESLNVDAMSHSILKLADKHCQKIEMFFFMKSRGTHIAGFGEVGLLELQEFEQPLPAPEVYNQFKLEYNRLINLINGT